VHASHDDGNEENEYNKAIALRKANELKKARPLFASIAVGDSLFTIKALHNLGSIANKQKQYTEAYAWFKKANQKSIILNHEPFSPSLKNMKTLENNYESTGELQKIHKNNFAPIVKCCDITDVAAGMFEFEAQRYTSDQTYPVIAWMQGKTSSGETISEETAEKNLDALRASEHSASPLLRLNILPYLSPEKGMVRFSYYFNPIIMCRPCEISGYEFHLNRPLLPWDELTSPPTDHNKKEAIKEYLEYYSVPHFPIASQEEAHYMQRQDKESAYASIVQCVKESPYFDGDNLYELWKRYVLAFLDLKQLGIDSEDRDLFDIINIYYNTTESAYEKLSFFHSPLEKPEVSPYNFMQSIKMMAILLKENYDKKYALSLLNTHLNSPKINRASKFIVLAQSIDLQDSDITLKYQILLKIIDILDESPLSFREQNIYINAILNVAILLYHGFDGQDPNPSEALKYYKQAADIGEIKGAWHAGRMLYNGFDGQAPNPSEAFKYFKLAADLGHDISTHNIGILFQQGFDGQAPDLYKALSYFKIAASLGNREAANNAAYLLWNGFKEESPNPSEALKYFIRGAELGHSVNAIIAGSILYNGFKGQSPSPSKALKYFKQAADLKNGNGAYNVGVIFENGVDGHEPNLAEALKYYQLAADLGCAAAHNNIKKIKQMMKPPIQPRLRGPAIQLFPIKDSSV